VTRPALRRFAVAATAVLAVAVAADGALWWWVCGQIEQQVAATIAAPPLGGMRVSAAPLRRGGWPFAAMVEVPSLAAEIPVTPGESLRWRADRVTVALEFAHPRTLIVAVAGPQQIQAGAAPPIPVTAARLRTLVPLETGVPVRALAIEVADLRATLPQGDFIVGALDIAGESRPAAQQGEPALTVAATARQVTLPPSQPPAQSWPLGPVIDRLAFDLAITGPVPRNPDLAGRAEAWRDGGGAVELRRFELAWGDVGLTGGATVALDAQLQPMGAATARITGHAAALRALTAAGVLTPRSTVAAGAVLALMARSPVEGGPPVVEVPFSLQNRTLALGRIPLLRLPELVWRPPS